MPADRVAIIGAGMAGLTCALELQAAGHAVTVFDKARGPGGRMASRRVDGGSFDHGAQFFRAWDPAFQAAVTGWRAEGVVAEWPGRIEGIPPDAPFFVGVPRMSALTRALGDRLRDLRLGVQVAHVRRTGDGWHLVDFDGTPLGTWRTLVVATPAPQAVPLLADAPQLAAAAARVAFDPCWTVLLTFAAPLSAAFDAQPFGDGPLGWIARNSSKPGRGSTERWILHGHPRWSQAHLEAPASEVITALRAAFAAVVPHPEPIDARAHRWRYARVTRPLDEVCVWDDVARIGLCGDGCIGARVEAAWLSGKALAARIG